MKKKNKKEINIINCELNVVDICSDNPIEWTIIDMEIDRISDPLINKIK